MRRVLALFMLTLVAACREPVAPTAKLGDETFANVCARCHGQDGRGGVAATNGVRPRDLTDPTWHASVGDGQIEAIIRVGKNPMPAFGNALSNPQIEALVSKVRRLQETKR